MIVAEQAYLNVVFVAVVPIFHQAEKGVSTWLYRHSQLVPFHWEFPPGRWSYSDRMKRGRPVSAAFRLCFGGMPEILPG